MTDDMSRNDLQNLWQSEKGEIDMDMIMDTRNQLERGRMLGRRLWNGMIWVFLGLFILAVSGEWTGFLLTRGWLSLACLLYLAFMIVRTQQLRRKIPLISELTPIEILENTIERAKTNLSFARLLYAGFPGGALVGFVSGYMYSALEDDNANLIIDAAKIDAGSDWILAVPAAGLLLGAVISIITGLRIAKKKQAELKILRARLSSLEREAV